MCSYNFSDVIAFKNFMDIWKNIYVLHWKCQIVVLLVVLIIQQKIQTLASTEYVMSDCEILRGKNHFPKTSISVPSILKKTVSKGIRR